MSIKRFASILAILVVVFSINLFIYYNNDHAECDIKVERIIGKNGKETTRTTHVCHERFSF